LRSVSLKMIFKLLPLSIRVLGRKAGPIDYGVDDQQVSPGVRDVNPMIFPGESNWEFRPTQRPWVFGVDVPDLPVV
jgi:hypothetical protein